MVLKNQVGVLGIQEFKTTLMTESKNLVGVFHQRLATIKKTTGKMENRSEIISRLKDEDQTSINKRGKVQ